MLALSLTAWVYWSGWVFRSLARQYALWKSPRTEIYSFKLSRVILTIILKFTLFLRSLPEIDIPVAQSTAVSSVNAALSAAEKIGYPVIMRSAFTLGGLGSGFANNPEELRDLAARGLALSPQVLVERSMKGWKEVEYEVVRDGADVRAPLPFILAHESNSSLLRTRLFAATWRTSTRLALIQETRLLSHPHRH
jgi:phosphoribosylaminoimidazole carboxylase (NCAIR synthetase)